jgi:Bacteriocin-protection, YdeI or OmpD-Associated/Domain of unknown function (DUF1905)
VELEGKSATGLVVPDDVVTALAAGKRPAVAVTVGDHTYRTTVMPMGGRFMAPLSAANRTAAGVAAGDRVSVEIVCDTAPREVVVPADLAEALAGDAAVQQFFDGLSYTHRKEWVRWIEEAKKAETRSNRVGQTIMELRQGKRTH